MIGIDWISSNRVSWEFGESRNRISKHCSELKSKPTKELIGKVYLLENIGLPARSKVILPTGVVYSSLTKEAEKSHLGTYPKVLRKGVYVARTLIPGD